MRQPDLITLIINFFLRIFAYKEKLGVNWWKKNSEYHLPPSSLLNSFDVKKADHFKQNVWMVSPKNTETDKAVLFIHGGGFHKGILGIHWRFASELCEELQQTIIIPDYPLAPKATAEKCLGFLLDTYIHFSENYGTDSITLIGDSNGGGMCHSLCQLMIRRKIRQPAQQILLSPWLDLSFSNPLIEDTEDSDPLLDPGVLRALSLEYAGNMDITDAMISPVYGNIRRVTSTTVFTGSHDITSADCRKLRVKAESEPVVFNYREFTGRFHNWMMFNTPDGKKTRKMIMSLIKYPPRDAELTLSPSNDFWKAAG